MQSDRWELALMGIIKNRASLFATYLPWEPIESLEVIRFRGSLKGFHDVSDGGGRYLQRNPLLETSVTYCSSTDWLGLSGFRQIGFKFISCFFFRNWDVRFALARYFLIDCQCSLVSCINHLLLCGSLEQFISICLLYCLLPLAIDRQTFSISVNTGPSGPLGILIKTTLSRVSIFR